MKNKMCKLADVYFKDMTPQLKVLAGLEPPMRGGGSDWYQPPKDLLEGKVNLKPIKNEYLRKLGFNGINAFGERLVQDHRKEQIKEKDAVLEKSDKDWKEIVILSCHEQRKDSSNEETAKNTILIKEAFKQFETLYATSITKIESILFDAAIKSIERIREKAFMKMTHRYENILTHGRNNLHNKYSKLLKESTETMKAASVTNIARNRKQTWNTIHDLNVEKHKAIEKLRKLLECQNLACQVYVAMKERETCENDIQKMKTAHKKKVKDVSENIAFTDLEIHLTREKKSKIREFDRIWQMKVCHIVKKFQIFVSYCLNLLPEYAEFFINMEKLMLLQLTDTIENPSCESIFVEEEEEAPVDIDCKARPFTVFGDLNQKIDEDKLYIQQQSTAEVPVLVINKRYIYAGCNNIKHFTETLGNFIEGNKLDMSDMQDDYDYSYSLPVKYSDCQQRSELKLESSLMQILQNEFPNVKKVNTDCCICQIPYCFCSPPQYIPSKRASRSTIYDGPTTRRLSPGKKITSRTEELEHEREPKLESYSQYLRPRRCACPKRAKKQLENHLPPYMLKTSKFEGPQLPDYEPCSLNTLKKLVAKYRNIPSVSMIPEKVESKTRDVATQYSDEEFDFLCTCYSDDELEKLYRKIIDSKVIVKYNKDLNNGEFQVIGDKLSTTHLIKSESTFAMDRAYELRDLLDSTPDLQNIFQRSDCNF